MAAGDRPSAEADTVNAASPDVAEGSRTSQIWQAIGYLALGVALVGGGVATMIYASDVISSGDYLGFVGLCFIPGLASLFRAFQLARALATGR